MTEYSASGIEDRRINHQKLVALDVDGTLVDHDGAMTDEVRDAARAVLDAGHQVIIATGRSLGATLPVIEKIGLQTGYGVCSNGGVTIKLNPELPSGFEVVRKETFSPRIALTALRGILPAALFAVEIADGEFLSTSSFQDASFGIQARSVDFEELLDAEAVRVVVHSKDLPLADFEAAVQGIGLPGVAYAVGWSSWLDIAAAGVTKASALEKLRADLALGREATVAVGDGFNDVEMLRWAHRGVAMGQAPQGVQEAATEITGTVYDDGAAQVLRSLL